MCGISGFYSVQRTLPAEGLALIAKRMTDAIRHRGPDGTGVWVDPAAGIALGHRRLSIIDLSETGAQPMASPSGRFVLVYNGEIYNYQDLRREIEAREPGIVWRGTSDTEVALAAFDIWGVAEGLKRLTGMFAIALWDKASRTLYLARDRMGEKPLYYGWSGSEFLFGSELKALRAHPQWRGEIHRDVLSSYLRHNYVPSPHSIYRGTYKLAPGCFLALDIASLKAGELPAPRPYWRLADHIGPDLQRVSPRGDDECIAELETLLKDAVKRQMVSDVPLGAFLSGGVDSSTIVALMQAQSSRPIKTFTIGFQESGFNEAEDARAVARHLGTDHQELYVTPSEAMEAIPLLPSMFDEPFADSSQIPTYLVSKLARNHVTVSLSGDGGDELFCGYNRYLWGDSIVRNRRWLPVSLRRAFRNGCRRIPPAWVDGAFAAIRSTLPRRMRLKNLGPKLQKLADVLAADSPSNAYCQLVSHWTSPDELAVGGSEAALGGGRRDEVEPGEFVSWMMYRDALTYLPDDILVKVDRAAMSVSLESRVPLLDHRVVEFAWRLPMNMKVREGTTKWLLRQVLYRHVPKQLIERPKMGFGVPIEQWLRGPLRDWAEVLLSPERLAREGYFNAAPIRQAWAEHLSGRRDWQYHLWDILMFQAWHEHSKAPAHPSASDR